MEEEVSTFFQMEEEAERLAHVGHECPVPKPKGVIGEFLGFRNARGSEQVGSSSDGGR
jgi:cytochrome c oxidase assembly factor 2